MKPSKTDPTGEQSFEKTFLVDPDRDEVSAGLPITTMQHTSGIKEGSLFSELPLFLDPGTGKEVQIAPSRLYLVKKVKEAGLSPQQVRRYPL